MVRTLFFLLLISTISFAQKTDTLSNIPAKADSIKKIVVDSTQKNSLVNKIFKSDTTKKENFLGRVFKVDSAKKANPARKALIRSLILPGWGQATNKEYWVIPIVYGAAAGGVFSFYVNNYRYKYYKSKLAEIIIDGNKEVMVRSFTGIGTKQSEKELGPFTQSQIEPVVNTFRRYRDLTVIVFAVGWALQAVQANVSAHLKTFDMSEDISLRIEPGIQSTNYGNAFGVSVVLKFK
ncbi:DUF5683 domain-containing protein [Emticicia sp. BO119]|uniref:DUF5683 domain-containing protein n=1 Tax=Emticicia sp. BO119 TaxID=2757768 RepID=UPI0015F0EA04|nr:DUF5683 domain-containing protein [Emticicia sp. BO119]MBA4849910.1 hypothetical protein [Emticicia sp. BO119]